MKELKLYSFTVWFHQPVYLTFRNRQKLLWDTKYLYNIYDDVTYRSRSYIVLHHKDDTGKDILLLLYYYETNRDDAGLNIIDSEDDYNDALLSLKQLLEQNSEDFANFYIPKYNSKIYHQLSAFSPENGKNCVNRNEFDCFNLANHTNNDETISVSFNSCIYNL